jgi:hypothetical protein
VKYFYVLRAKKLQADIDRIFEERRKLGSKRSGQIQKGTGEGLGGNHYANRISGHCNYGTVGGAKEALTVAQSSRRI